MSHEFCYSQLAAHNSLRSHVSRRVDVVGPISRKSAPANPKLGKGTNKVGMATVNRS